MNKKLLFIWILTLLLLVGSVSATIDWDIETQSFTPLMNVTNSETGILDLSHNGNDGTVDGATIGFTNASQDSWDFKTGVNQGIILASPTMDFSSNELSISFWYKSTNAKPYSKINSWALVGGIDTYGANLWRFTIGDGSSWISTGAFTTSMVQDSWEFITVTYDGSNKKLYVNGSYVEQIATTGSVGTNANSVNIGYNDNTYYYDGLLNSVAMYNKSLTSTEITDLFNEGRKYDPYDSPATSYIDITSNVAVTQLSCFNGSTWDNGSTSGGSYTTVFVEGDSIDCDFNVTNYWDVSKNSQTADFSVDMEKYPYLTLTNAWNGTAISGYAVYVNSVNYTSLTNPSYFPVNGTYSTTIYKTNYITKVISLKLLADSNNATTIYQTETVFQPKEIFSNSNVAGMGCTINGTYNLCNETFYINAGIYNVTLNKTNYTTKIQEVNLTDLFSGTVNVYNISTSVLNLDLDDAVTSSLIATNNTVTITNNDYNTSFDYFNVNGTHIIDLIEGNYTIDVTALNYANNTLNLSINASETNQTILMYSQNSVWVYAFNSLNGVALTNFTVSVYNSTHAFNFDDNNSGVARGINISGGVYTVKVNKIGFSEGTYSITMTGGSHQTLNAYLSTNTENVILTIKNSVSGGIVTGATVSQYQIINASWTLINSMLSDITGRTQFAYGVGTEYRFTIARTDFISRTFLLTPIFSSYDVPIIPTVSNEPNNEQQNYNIFFSPYNFYDEQLNEINFTITSGMGTLENYTIWIQAPNVDENYSYSNAIGGIYNYTINISGGVIGDLVTITYTIKESGKGVSVFSYVYPITNDSDVGTLADWDESENTLGMFGRTIIATLLILLLTGVVATVTSLSGVNPLLPSAFTLLTMTIIFGLINFIPRWSVWISGMGLLILIIFALRNE